MKIAFFWTPQFAADILSGLIKYPEVDVQLIVSQPDKAVGRRQELQATPVKQVALSSGIKVLQPVSLKKDQSFEVGLRLLDLDYIVVVAYWKIIPKSLLELPKYGCINLHGSILPAYRWASPVQAALRDGVSETGLTTMFMSEGMDEWDILQIAKIKVDKVDRTEDIFQKFVDIGPELLRDTLVKIQNWELRWIPQNHLEASYCGKISKEDGEISFQKQSVEEIYNLFRAYNPWPGIYTFYNGKRLVIEWCFLDSLILDHEDVHVWSFIYWWSWKNKEYGMVCKEWTVLWVTRVKLEGKKSIDIASFVNGNKEILEYIFD